LAILLSLNAGFINAAGFISFAVLTTNVTGHAALLAVDIANHKWRAARMVALWLLLFLSGAFGSALYIRKAGANKPYAYSVPIIGIILILIFLVVFGKDYDGSLQETEYFAGSLLFAMGMQNAMVSMISGSVVRTTHLTGMFTDLGIELSKISFRGQSDRLVKRKIALHISIIASFLMGGVLGSFMFIRWRYNGFLVPVALLILALVYDYFRVYLRQMMRRKL
jgi:uncharacterized membrane protein YoaK (UPF0700 family)